MTKKDIKISIITSAHNEAEHIAECIESVLNQRYTNFEMVIADDASTDDTANIVERFSKSDNGIKTQYLKRVLKDRDVLSQDVQNDIIGFKQHIAFEWSRELMVGACYFGVVMERRLRGR